MKRKFYYSFILAVVLMLGNSTKAFSGPTITVHPVSIAECSGYVGTLSFSAAAIGKTLSYQWQYKEGKFWYNITNVPSTSSTLSYTFTSHMPLPVSLNGLTVRCAITDFTGTSYTNQAFLYVNNNITSQPASQTKVVGESVTFSVTATGKNLTYQWQRYGVVNLIWAWRNILYATSSSYTIASVTEGNAGDYRCVVSGSCTPSVISSIATLTVYPVLSVTKHPENQTECLGEQASFQINTNITEGLSYQWQYLVYKGTEWVDIPAGNGGTINPLIIPSITSEMNRGSFRCTASGAGGQTVTSNAAMLYVYTPATITTHPTSATKETGESVTFNVSAGGTSTNRTYQWQVNKGSGYSDIAGATLASLTLSNLTISDNGTYRCVVKNICNSTGAYSNGAVLTVNPPAYPNGWFLKKPSGYNQNLTAVHPVSENSVYYLPNETNKVLKTINGGENWTEIVPDFSFSFTWQCIYFLTETTGFIGGRNGIAKTTNGGANWTYTNLQTQFYPDIPANSFDIKSIYFLNSTQGWAVGTNGIICYTPDGGANWHKVSSKYDGMGSYVTTTNLNTVYFIDSNNGFVGGEGGFLYRTTNGGDAVNKWSVFEEIPSILTGTVSDMKFVSATKGFLTTTTMKGLYVTNNSGANWTRISNSDIRPSDPNLYFTTVDFIDADNGYIAGRSYDYGTTSWFGIVLKTFNGGSSWVTQSISSAPRINRLRMLNANLGWFAGESGGMFKTGKGGCHTPVVSLYEDKTFCSGQNYVLRADTFSANVNGVRYLWTPGNDITGTKTVTTTNTYSVTVTNECNVTASDAVTVTFRPLPDADAGLDTAICSGETTQLNASGGVGYLWNNAHLLDNDEASNPVTEPLFNTTVFTVIVTDEHGCSKSDNVTVTVKPIPSSDFNAPEFVCGTAPAAISYASSTAGKSFEWDFGEGDIDSAVSVIPEGPYQVSWEATGDKPVSLIVTQNNCVSPVTQKFIQVRTMPSSVFLLPEGVCGSNQVVAEYTGSSNPDAEYTWNFGGGSAIPGTGQGPHQVAWVSGGTKTVTLSVTENGCLSSTTERNIYAAYPYQNEKICVVTIDLETGKNMVVWERTPDKGTASYNIYRNVAGTYDLIGNVPYNDISLFVDMSSNPESYQAFYKISVVDTCGNESAKSPFHKTMLLQYTGVQLSWDNYQVEGGAITFVHNVIYRGETAGQLDSIMTLDKDLRLFTDTEGNAGTKKLYYRVAGRLASQCAPANIAGGKKASSGPFVHAFSNLEDNQKASGINDPSGDKVNLTVYPNPFSSETNLRYTLREPSNVRIEIYNIIGERVSELLQVNNQAPGTYIVSVEAADLNYMNGLYYVKVYVNDAYAIKKMMMVK